MRKLLTLILILCTLAAFAEMRGGALYDPGAIRADGTGPVADVIKVATGTAAAPAYSFGSDPDTGIYSAGANSLGFSAGGVDRLKIFGDVGEAELWPNSTGYTTLFTVASGSTAAGVAATTNSKGNIWFFGARKDSYGGASGTDRFNLLYGVTPLLTATIGGNVLIGTTTDDGANKLQVNGGVSVKAPYVLARNNTTFAIANDTSTIATFTAEVFDDKNNFAPSTGVFTAPQSGLYELWAKITWDNISAVGPRIARFEKNGDQTFMPSQSYAGFVAGGGYPQICLAGTIYLSANDTVVLKNYQASGGDLNIIGASNEMVLSITYLRDR